MTLSNQEFKRARPALGTILSFRLEGPLEADPVAMDEQLSLAFDYSEELERKFSKFREMSDVSRLNQASVGTKIPVSAEFVRLLPLAAEIWQVSQGAFDPFSGIELAENPIELSFEGRQNFALKNRPCQLDLSGIAKGFIVDELVHFVRTRLPGFSGVINAGGDLRFFGRTERTADVRMATPTRKFQRVQLAQDSLATSAQTEALENPLSTTEYRQNPRAGLTGQHCVSAVATSCALADALTKVGWFAADAVAQSTAERFKAEILVFDSEGKVSESFSSL